MPYNIRRGASGCSGYAVVGDDGKVKGCHKTRSEALAHQRALYANVKDVKKYDIDSAITKAQGPCWEGYEMVGWKRKNGKRVPNCVPKDSTKKNSDVGFEIDEDHPKCEGVALVEIDGTSVICYPSVEAAQAALADMARKEPEASVRPSENEIADMVMKEFWRGVFR